MMFWKIKEMLIVLKGLTFFSIMAEISIFYVTMIDSLNKPKWNISNPAQNNVKTSMSRMSVKLPT